VPTSRGSGESGKGVGLLRVAMRGLVELRVALLGEGRGQGVVSCFKGTEERRGLQAGIGNEEGTWMEEL